MLINELISLVENKLTTLNNNKVSAFNSGDVLLVEEIDKNIIEAEKTLEILRRA